MNRSPLKVAWVPTHRAHIPQNAVVGGNDNTFNEKLFIGNYPANAFKGGFEVDTTLYVARAKARDGGLCVGKLNPEHGVCYISWGGKEHARLEYEVLTCV